MVEPSGIATGPDTPALADTRAVSRPLRIGCTCAVLRQQTVPLLRSWRRTHPHVPLDVVRQDNSTAGTRLRCSGRAGSDGKASRRRRRLGRHAPIGLPTLLRNRRRLLPMRGPIPGRHKSARCWMHGPDQLDAVLSQAGTRTRFLVYVGL
ncbi:hypothetical protein ACFTXM_45380 [Streptomyces sp. NPDC056930]|uniref:hypothetical protein n=1 Tax=Streptomyces sp. NPDC056930 TaxID=3345967 RepID=UPI003633D398